MVTALNYRQRGVTYLAVMFLIAIMGAVLAATGILWRTAQQRQKEEELLFVGDQFRRAILLYYEKSPGPIKRYPNSLDDLLQDDRFMPPQRHLRKIFFDPMTRKAQWGFVLAQGGGIMGVYSLSGMTPIKTSNFGLANEAFDGSGKYSDWVFSYQPIGQGR